MLQWLSPTIAAGGFLYRLYRLFSSFASRQTRRLASQITLVPSLFFFISFHSTPSATHYESKYYLAIDGKNSQVSRLFEVPHTQIGPILNQDFVSKRTCAGSISTKYPSGCISVFYPAQLYSLGTCLPYQTRSIENLDNQEGCMLLLFYSHSLASSSLSTYFNSYQAYLTKKAITSAKPQKEKVGSPQPQAALLNRQMPSSFPFCFMLTRSAKVTSFRVTKNRAVNETASLKRPAFGKNSASALIKKIKKELVPLLATDLEGILDKTVIDKLLMVQSRPEDNKLDLLILPLPHCFLPA